VIKIHKSTGIILPVILSVKTGLSIKGMFQNTVLRKYLGLRGMTWQEAEEKSKMRSYIKLWHVDPLLGTDLTNTFPQRWILGNQLVIEWFRLALSKGPNWVVSCPLTWGRKQIQFPKRCVL
jgi:hypothetical protein